MSEARMPGVADESASRPVSGTPAPVAVGGAEIVRRFSSSSTDFDRFRPSPPAALIAFVRSMAPVGSPTRVVDLGCGTGLSTWPWADHCDEVTGVDPSADLLDAAGQGRCDPRVRFVQGWGHDTGLPDRYAAVVTCSASFHWMEPEPTLGEIARILRPRGVFAVYGPQVPPVASGGWALAAQAEDFLRFAKAEDAHALGEQAPRATPWAGILRHLKASPLAGYCNEFCFHQAARLTSAQFCGWVMTVSYVRTQLQRGHVSVAERFRQLCDEAERQLGPGLHDFLWCYRLILMILREGGEDPSSGGR